MKQIKSQEQLDKMLEKLHEGSNLHCFVLLAGGLCRSSKDISFESNKDYHVYNGIDDTEETISHDDLMESFPIGEAITKGAFYLY